MKNIKLGNWKNNKAFTELLVYATLIIFLLIIFKFFNFTEIIKVTTRNSEKIIELLIFFVLLSILTIIYSINRWLEYHKEKLLRKELEKRMDKSRAESQAVLDGVPDLIMQVNANMRIQWANKAVLEKIPNAIGKRISEAFNVIGESVIETYCKWAIVTGHIEEGVKYQPNIFGKEVGSYWEAIGIPLHSKDGTIYGAIAIGRDVTERMRMEHTTNLLASIVESTDDAIYGMTYDGTVLSWNLGAEKIYDFDMKEILGKNAFSTVLPDDRPFFQQRIEEVIRTQEISRFEITRLKKNKEKIIVSVTLCPFVDATGRKIGVSAIDRDITRSKLAEKALIESETRYRELFENMSSGVAVFEPILNGNDFIIKEFNRGAEIIDNIEQKYVIGKRLSKLTETINAEDLDNLLKDVYKSKESVQDLIKIKKNDKIISWRDIKIYYLPSGEIVAIYDDITERVLAEEALINSEERFRTLVSTAPDGIILTDATGKILEVNIAFAHTYGYEPNQIIGKNFSDFFVDEKAKQLAMEILTKSNYKDKQINEISTITKEGKNIYVELSVAQLRDEKNNLTGMIVIARDITLRKMYEAELQESREQLRSLAVHLQTAREEERKNIAFEIHDELGYALTALKLDLAWMVKKMKLNDETMIKKSKSMAELIDTTINKVRSISTQLRPSILDHFGLIAAIEWQANEFQKRTGIRCKLNIDIKDDVEFLDPYRTAVFRIFQESLTNITRHAKASRVDVNFVEKENTIELIVSDNGIGMKDFNKSKSKSLGLIGMRERANSLGAEIDFISEDGAGTSVLLKVPIEKFKKEEKL